MLRCPNCHQPLLKAINHYQCVNRHNFDQAKSGYVNLYLNKKQQPGDDQLMINARHAFLQQAYYQPLRDQLSLLVDQYQPQTILDAGCGEGYYTSQFTRTTNQVYAIDLSTHGLKLLNKRNPQVISAISNLFDLAIMDQSIDLIFNVFVPPSYDEMIRIMKPNGHLIIVSGGPDHLIELKQQLYTNPISNPPMILDAKLQVIDTIQLKQTITVNQQDLINLLMMTPYYYTTSITAKNQLQQLTQLTITIDFIITITQSTNQPT
jgi:23S rRNA (guanine745-N1)-methyltransferase